MKLTIKVCFILCAGPTETQNQDLRPFLESFQWHESNGDLKIRKRAFIDNRVFRGKHYCLDLREISVT